MPWLLKRLTIGILLGGGVFVGRAPAASLDVRVVNFVTNEPVANADLTLSCLKPRYRHDPTCPGKIQTARTAANGTFRFNSLSGAKYLAAATGAPGLVSVKASEAEVDYGPKAGSLEAVLKLAPESAMAGKVVDQQGNAKAGIELEALRLTPSGAFSTLKAAARTRSDENGSYVFRSLSPGNYYVATVLPTPNGLPLRTKRPWLNELLWYAPGSANIDGATVTHLEIGQSSGGVDMQIRPLTTYRI